MTWVQLNFVKWHRKLFVKPHYAMHTVVRDRAKWGHELEPLPALQSHSNPCPPWKRALTLGPSNPEFFFFLFVRQV
jgi:hypothetical protein